MHAKVKDHSIWIVAGKWPPNGRRHLRTSGSWQPSSQALFRFFPSTATHATLSHAAGRRLAAGYHVTYVNGPYCEVIVASIAVLSGCSLEKLRGCSKYPRYYALCFEDYAERIEPQELELALDLFLRSLYQQ